MDGRAAEQCTYIMDKAKGDPALMVNCGGCGPLSAEWMIPKALWVKQQEPEVWDRVEHVCDKQDYMNYLLTGKLCMSGWTRVPLCSWRFGLELSVAQPLAYHVGGGFQRF